MIEIALRDLDGKPVWPLSVMMQTVPRPGDRIDYWAAGKVEDGVVTPGLGMSAHVDRVFHRIFKAEVGSDHQIYVTLRDLQTVNENGHFAPSDSDAVGQSDGPRRA